MALLGEIHPLERATFCDTINTELEPRPTPGWSIDGDQVLVRILREKVHGEG
jgi:hypothetical protein